MTHKITMYWYHGTLQIVMCDKVFVTWKKKIYFNRKFFYATKSDVIDIWFLHLYVLGRVYEKALTGCLRECNIQTELQNLLTADELIIHECILRSFCIATCTIVFFFFYDIQLLYTCNYRLSAIMGGAPRLPDVDVNCCNVQYRTTYWGQRLLCGMVTYLYLYDEVCDSGNDTVAWCTSLLDQQRVSSRYSS